MPRTLRLFLFGFLLTSIVASTGCIEFERAITLNKDLSGKAKFRMTMNMEPIARIGASMEHAMSGKPGAVTEEEVQAAIKKMSEESAAKNEKQPTAADLGPLPEGFTVDEITQKIEGLKMTLSVTIGFKDIRKLSTLKLGDPSGSSAMSGGADLQPFDGIEVKDEGTTLLITAKLLTNGDSKMMAPKSDAGAAPAPPEGLSDMLKEMMSGMGGDASLEKQMQEAVKDFGEIFRIDTPMTVVDTNATKREAGAVIWQQKMADLMKAEAAGGKAPATTMTVRLKK